MRAWAIRQLVFDERVVVYRKIQEVLFDHLFFFRSPLKSLLQDHYYTKLCADLSRHANLLVGWLNVFNAELSPKM